MTDKAARKPLPLLNTTISELPVNDLPIDCLTRDKLVPASGRDRKPSK